MSVDWGGIGAVAGVGLGIIFSLIRVIIAANRLNDTVERHNTIIERMGKHQDDLMWSEWQSITRIATMEDHLTERDGYRPPRIMPIERERDGE